MGVERVGAGVRIVKVGVGKVVEAGVEAGVEGGRMGAGALAAACCMLLSVQKQE